VRLLAVTAVLMLASYRSWSQSSNGPCGQTRHENVSAQNLHYLPGEPVTITGTGFAPSCDVLMAANVPDGTIDLGAATTDPSGNLTYTYLLGPVTGDYSIQAETTDGAISLATAQFSSSIFVMTDKTDYEPGETVTFSGRGFEPGETIGLTVQQTYPGGVAVRAFSAVSDASGAFVNADLVVEEQDRNTALSVTATGQSSGRSAGADFHDATLVFVQKIVNQTTATTVTSLNAVYTAGPTSGNLLVAVVGAFGTGPTLIGKPGGWSVAHNEAGDATTPSQGIFYKISAGAADNSVTPTFTPASTGTITIYEFSGVLSSSDPLDGRTSNTGGSTAAASTGTLTPTSGSTTDFLVGGVTAQSATQTLAMQAGTVTNGFTVEAGTGGSGTVQGGASGAQKVATQSADKKTSPAVSSTGFTITGTGVPASILGWRGQIAAFMAKSNTTTAVSTPGPSVVGQTVTVTATVSAVALSGSGTAPIGGTADIKDGATTICPGATVTAGVASCNVFFTLGSHSLTAVYSGDGSYNGSTSPAFSQSVTIASTTTVVVSNRNPSLFPDFVTFTATVSAAGSITPTGTVTFKDGGSPIGGCASVTLSGGQATCTQSPALTVGSHSITAVYAGTTSFSTSTSPTLTQTVNAAATCPTLTVDNSGVATTAYVTIQGAVNALSNPGPCTINVKAGTYNESVTLTSPRNNSSATLESQRIVIQRDSSAAVGSVIVNATGANGFNFSGAPGANFMTIKGLDITGATGAGIILGGGSAATSNITIDSNLIHDDGTSGGVTGGIDVNANNTNTTIVNNLIRNNGRDNISLANGVNNAYIVNNTIFGAGFSGINWVSALGNTAFLVNNLIVGNGNFGVTHTNAGAPLGITLINNVIYGNTSGDFSSPAADFLDSTDSGNRTTTGSGLGTGLTKTVTATFNSGPKTITRTVGSFITDGFAVGHTITTTNGSNPGPFTITVVAASTITVAETVVGVGPVSTTFTDPTGIAGCTFADCLNTHTFNEIFVDTTTFNFHLKTSLPISPAIDKGVNNFGSPERVPTVDFEGTSRPQGAQVDAGFDEAGASSATLNVIKHVVNDNGGTAVASAWNLAVSSNNGGTGTGNAAGVESPGTAYTLQPGKQYSVAESGGPSGYTESDSADCTILSAVAGTSYTCTITNDDTVATLNVIKHVVNDNGGTAVASAWNLAVGSTDGGTGTGNAAGSETGTLYTLLAGKTYNTTESGGPSGYTPSSSANCTGLVPAVGGTYTCTITNDDVAPTLNVIKHVVNDNGGTAVASAWNLAVGSPDGGTGTGNAAGSETGTLYTLLAGKTYNTTESGGPSGYTPSSSANCTGLVPAVGGTYTCTITNDDVAPTLNVIKHVVNDNGGTAVASAWNLAVASPDGGTGTGNAAGSETGTLYTLLAGKTYNTTESGGPAGYTPSSSASCTGLVPAVGGTYTCTITNDDVAPTLNVIKHVVNDNGGTAVASAWNLAVASPDGGTGTGNAAGSETGTLYTLLAGKTYNTTESGGPAGYTPSSSASCTGLVPAVGGTYTCTITNDDVAPTLNVIKHVMNDNGGSAVAGNWTLTVSSSNGGSGTGAAAGVESPGTPYTLEGGKAYSVAESGGPTGYFESDSADCSILSAVVGASYTCTITNNDVQPTLTVNKVTNPLTDGGLFNLLIGPTPYATNVGNTGTTSPVSLNAGGYTVSETQGTGTFLVDYATLITGDCAADGSVTLSVGDNKVCTIVNTKKAKLTVNKVTDPTTDPGKFNLQIDGNTAGTGGDVGNGGTTGKVTLDVISQPDGNAHFGDTTHAPGQSFTALTDGSVTEIDVRSRTTTTTATLYIYNGNVGSGTPGSIGGPVYTQFNVSLTDATGDGPTSGFSPIVLTTPFAVLTGQQYSFVIDDVGGVSLSGTASTDPYAGGTRLDSYATPVPTSDLAFQVIFTHTVSETAGTLTSLSDYNSVISGACAADGTISLHPGDDLTCTITNTHKTRLTVIKNVTNDNGGTKGASDWTLTVSSSNGGSGTGSAAGAGSPGTVYTLEVGKQYSVSESVLPGGYSQSSSGDCTIASAVVGSSYTCTITNDDDAPSLTLVKTVTNDNGGAKTPADWTLTATGPTPISGTTPVASGATFSAGTYTLSETGPGGYTASAWVCVLTGRATQPSPTTVALGLGGSATCTINNDDNAPSLTLVKTVTNDNGGAKTPADWTLSAAGPTPLSGTTPVASGTSFSAGLYTLSESGPGGYTASAWVCVLTGRATQPSPTTVALGLGGSATCTINNDDNAPSLTLVKTVTNDNGGAKTPADWTLSAAGPTPLSGTTPVASGTSFSAGLYTLSESGPGGYTASAWVCVLTGRATQPSPTTVALGLGGSATCTINNDDQVPSLTLVKTVTNDNGGNKAPTDWTLSAAGPTPISGTTPVTSSATFSAGVYTLSESGPGGYTASNWVCVLTGRATQPSPTTVALGLGGSATCTINNDDQAPSLTLNKTVINNNGGNKTPADWTLSASGPTPLSGPGPTVISPSNFSAGVYTLSESGPAGYSASAWVCVLTGRATQNGNTLNVGLGGTANCTITNDDIAPTITVIKSLSPASDPGRFNLQIDNVAVATNAGNGGSSGPIAVTANTSHTVNEAPGSTATVPPTVLANYTSTINCGAGTIAGSTTSVTLLPGQNAICTITNTVNDQDGDGIPDFLDCSPTVFENRVVDPAGILAAYPVLRYPTLQAAVIAAADNDVISFYGNTTENVIIGTTTGSGAKDLRIIGCGHKVTASVVTNPVITVQVSAGAANDATNAVGAETDIQIEDLSVLHGSIGFLIQTTKPSGVGTSTLLKGIRSDTNGPSFGTGNPTVANPGHGVQIVGDGNEVRGANSIGTNSGDGINLAGNSNLLNTNRIQSNKGDGIDVTGSSNTIVANKVGEKSVGNKGNGILVAGGSNTINENDVFGNTKTGINVTGGMNLVYKNDVGDAGKGNGQGGILITGDSNLLGKALSENNVFANTGIGVSIIGNKNMLSKNNVGDTGKFNTGIGINVKGFGNMLDQNDVFSNGGDGIDIQGSTAANPNQVTNNAVGDRGKGNGGDGIMAGVAADVGNVIHDNTIYANTGVGLRMAGASAQVYGNSIGDTSKGNVAGGIISSGNSNVFGTAPSPNSIFGSTGIGMKITGDSNTIFNNNVGDSGKGNTGDGIDVIGKGNTINQNDVYANGKLVGTTYSGDGINVSGGTAASPNVISNNLVGSGGKGNFGNGILVAGTGDGTLVGGKIEIIGNTTRSNGLIGISVTGTGHQLQNNVSGGSGAYPGGQDNRKCEFTVVTGNFNAGGNTANGTAFSGTFPQTCLGTP
jgi:hypothetical protein